MNICIRNKGLITGNTRNRGNKELSRQSNCSILQGTKVGSAKERNQHISIPQRVSSQYILLQAELSNLKEVEYPPAGINIPQQYTYIHNKHPRQSCSKDRSPAAHQIFKRITSPAYQNFPRRVQSSKVGIYLPQAISLSPVDSGSLSLAEHERVVRLYSKSYFLNRI